MTALLAQVPLFRGLEADALARIAQGTRELHVAKGQIIFDGHPDQLTDGILHQLYGEEHEAVNS